MDVHRYGNAYDSRDAPAMENWKVWRIIDHYIFTQIEIQLNFSYKAMLKLKIVKLDKSLIQIFVLVNL